MTQISDTADNRLTTRNYWNDVHRHHPDAQSERPADDGVPQHTWKTRLVNWAANHLGDGGYASYLVREVGLAPHLPPRPDWKMLEVGSAPGRQLVRYHLRFGYEPYGVEYTPNGVEENRRLFTEQGLNPQNVIQADFFSDQFQSAYRERFDVVYSGGFIEHFDDVKPVVAKHVNLLKTDGRLIVSIPNLRGLNGRLARFFHPGVLDIHNLEIMQREVFADLFERLDLQTMFCDHIGVFSLGIQNAKPGSWKRSLIHVARIANSGLGLGMRLTLNRRRWESAYLSPYLLYVGRKVEEAKQEGIGPI